MQLTVKGKHLDVGEAFRTHAADSMANLFDKYFGDAIEAGDSQAVVDLIVEHWELSRDLLEYFVKPDPLAFEMAAANS